MATEWKLDTVVRGVVEVEVEGVGTFRNENPYGEPLVSHAANCYVFLTGRSLCGNPYGFFDLISADPGKRKIVVRRKK
jgi:hypothetical protein